ncbi:MAG: 50S ribosomal protein L2 [Candidatus Nezhaarchaeales archaeon]
MGKRLLVQRRGRGGSVFRSPSWKRVGDVKYPSLAVGSEGKEVGRVVEILHDPGRGAPVARVVLESGEEFLMVAPEGLEVGQTIEVGGQASLRVGCILPLKAVPEGTQVCNVEVRPGDGGKLARSSGTYAVVVSHAPDKTVIQLPSGELKQLSPLCRATIGIVAGGGRIEKPLLKAGKKYHLSRVKAWKYPTVRGKAMSPYAHPHGGGSHPTGSTPSGRGAPPGAKVGHIAPRRTGRRKG